MFEYKVTWAEDTEVPTIYQFETFKEAKTFLYGLTEPEHRIPGCPKAYRIEKGRWEAPPAPRKKQSYFSLAFSILIGVWTVAWWYVFHLGNGIVVEEYILAGSASMLVTYLTLLIWAWFKKR